MFNRLFNPKTFSRGKRKKSRRAHSRSTLRAAHSGFRRRNIEVKTHDAAYDAESGTLVSNLESLDGQFVELLDMEDPNEEGVVMVTVTDPRTPGETLRVPLYGDVSAGGTEEVTFDPTFDPTEGPDPSSTAPDPTTCCVDIDAMAIICEDPGNMYHGAEVLEIGTIHDDGLVSLTFMDPMTNQPLGGRFYLCDVPPDNGGGGGGGFEGCCVMLGDFSEYDEEFDTEVNYNGMVVCDDTSNPLHNTPVIGSETNDGTGFTFSTGGDEMPITLPLCEQPPPLECCYDTATGLLICEDGTTLEVSLLDLSVDNADGKTYARVEHPNLPNGAGTFPVCEEEVPPDCCFDGNSSTLVCEDGELTGMPAGVISERMTSDGRRLVVVAWEGGQAEMELCTEECPPAFCCVNLDTSPPTFVCPGEPSLHGTPADVVDVVSNNGYNMAQLSDGTTVPVCGAQCPPPQLCPECPPGQWMSPDKQCVDIPPPEECPVCPPGYLLDTDTGECVQCPPPGECPPPGQWPQCPPGYLLNTQTGECVQCPTGWDPPTWIPPDDGDCCLGCLTGCGCDCDDGHGTKKNPRGKRIKSKFLRKLQGRGRNPGPYAPRRRDILGGCPPGMTYDKTYGVCIVAGDPLLADTVKKKSSARGSGRRRRRRSRRGSRFGSRRGNPPTPPAPKKSCHALCTSKWILSDQTDEDRTDWNTCLYGCDFDNLSPWQKQLLARKPKRQALRRRRRRSRGRYRANPSYITCPPAMVYSYAHGKCVAPGSGTPPIPHGGIPSSPLEKCLESCKTKTCRDKCVKKSGGLTPKKSGRGSGRRRRRRLFSR